MEEWSLLDWFTRMLGIIFFIRGIRYTRGRTVEYHNAYGGKSTASDDADPKIRNIVRVAGVVGIILGLLMIIYGGGVLDILFPFF
ncbi:hypothetical protein R70723_06245 [Paenibacillus sp. FSL R7-0273]|uniref:hypothetical protein n=1 Tax=Paenibacillus sp. FSL R7-0273 TaxID=1536772 RepID=UPI0004F59529|nr:hypothetical protein [Paenibacillus sp. FSL R7-0273]AIQ45541.1 hypothetical protein R70723_06245 [Paenibacillus sp. FSL R7-0273]OMF89086.1 hypothetical protein BK144_19945 [Paenibacillus sp. FSL R7-0273]